MSQEQKDRARQQEREQDKTEFEDLTASITSRTATDDIDDERNGTQNIGVQPQNLGPNGRHNAAEQRAPEVEPARNAGEDDEEGDVTSEDRQMLSAAYQNRDMDDPDEEESMLDQVDDDGDPINEPAGSYGSAGADLDVPGSEDDDASEDIGEEDEENNYYSLGGDRQADGLEDNNTER